MAIQIQVRRGTAAQWASANPTLLAGEIGAETDTGKFKVGDGATTWNSLSYSLSPAAYSAVNTQAGTTYTFALGDEIKVTSFTSSSAVTATIPANSSVAFPIGTRLDIIQYGTGQVTVEGAAGVTLRTPTHLKTRDQYSFIAFVKIAPDEWVATGDLAVL